MKLTIQEQVRDFGIILRRSLYLMRIAEHNLSFLSGKDVTPPQMKILCDLILQSHMKLHNYMIKSDGKETAKKIKEDLNSDKLGDISDLIDAVMGVANISEVVDFINEHKVIAQDKTKAA